MEDHFWDNVERILGMHRLTSKQAAVLFGVSASAMSKWSSRERKPSFETALKISEILRMEPGRLARADFGDLLAHELADTDRFGAIETEAAKVRRESRAREHLRLAEEAMPDVYGEPEEGSSQLA
jgi:transcriptional regulator with XRE-family HTH domain